MGQLNAFQKAKADALTFRPLPYMNEFLEELRIGGRNKDYIRTMQNGLSHFADFMRDEGVLHPEEISRIHLLRFQGHVNDRDEWSKSYRTAILKKVRAWCNWLEESGTLEKSSPWRGIKLPSTPKVPNPLSDDEFQQLFAAHRQGAFSSAMTPFSFHRREMILCLLYAWGLRIHELEAINLTDMDVRLDFVQVRNKGGGTKTMPYSPEIKKVFQRWAANRARFAVAGQDSLLIIQSGERLSKDGIYKIVAHLGEQAGVSVHPHQLRDTFGTHLLDNNVAVERAARLMGHTNIKQTLQYARVNDQPVADSHIAAIDPILAYLFGSMGNTRSLLESTS